MRCCMYKIQYSVQCTYVCMYVYAKQMSISLKIESMIFNEKWIQCRRRLEKVFLAFFSFSKGEQSNAIKTTIFILFKETTYLFAFGCVRVCVYCMYARKDVKTMYKITSVVKDHI